MAGKRGWALACALALASAAAVAQTRVGEVLDAGGHSVSPQEFEKDVVQRELAGPLVTGVIAEFMYVPGGTIEGRGGGPAGYGAEWDVRVRGAWKVDNGRVCTSVVLDGATIRANFSPRCQYWYRLGNRYFVADSNDRTARTTPRSLVR